VYLSNSDGHWQWIEVLVKCDQHTRLHCRDQTVDHVMRLAENYYNCKTDIQRESKKHATLNPDHYDKYNITTNLQHSLITFGRQRPCSILNRRC